MRSTVGALRRHPHLHFRWRDYTATAYVWPALSASASFGWQSSALYGSGPMARQGQIELVRAQYHGAL